MEWMIMNNYDNFEISRDGTIRNRKTKKLKVATKKPNGYLSVSIYQDGRRGTYYVHRLVAEHFIIKPFGTSLVRHIDGNRSNNLCSNLEWVRPSNNQNNKAGDVYIPPNKVKKLLKQALDNNLLTEEEIKELFDIDSL